MSNNSGGMDGFSFGFGIVITIVIMLFSILWSYTLFRDRGVYQKTKEPTEIKIIGNDTTYIYRNK